MEAYNTLKIEGKISANGDKGQVRKRDTFYACSIDGSAALQTDPSTTIPRRGSGYELLACRFVEHLKPEFANAEEAAEARSSWCRR